MKCQGETIGDSLKWLRGKDTMAQFAEKVRLSTSHICALEKGDKLPSFRALQTYADVTQVGFSVTFKPAEKD